MRKSKSEAENNKQGKLPALLSACINTAATNTLCRWTAIIGTHCYQRRGWRTVGRAQHPERLRVPVVLGYLPPLTDWRQFTRLSYLASVELFKQSPVVVLVARQPDVEPPLGPRNVFKHLSKLVLFFSNF